MRKSQELSILVTLLNTEIGLKDPRIGERYPQDGGGDYDFIDPINKDYCIGQINDGISLIRDDDVLSDDLQKLVDKFNTDSDYFWELDDEFKNLDEGPIEHQDELIDVHVEELSVLETNPRFKDACPPLNKEEYERLEKLLLADGKILQPILTWKNQIVDGHNRYELALKHKLSYTVREMAFRDEAAAILWIKRNAVSQRNLTDYEKYELIKDIEQALHETGKEKKKRKMKMQEEVEKHDTLEEIGKKVGVSRAQIAKAKKIDKEAPDEVKQELRTGKKTIDKAYKELKEVTPPPPEHDLLNKGARSLEKWVDSYSKEELFDEFMPLVREILKAIKDKAEKYVI